MQNNIKLKKLIEETFGYKCKEDCKYIYASSSEELGKKFERKLKVLIKLTVMNLQLIQEYVLEALYQASLLLLKILAAG